jgi:hypothetical protein
VFKKVMCKSLNVRYLFLVKLLPFEMREKHQDKVETAPLPNLTQKSVISTCDILKPKVAVTFKLSKNIDFDVLYQITVKLFIVILVVRKLNSRHFPKRYIESYIRRK